MNDTSFTPSCEIGLFFCVIKHASPNGDLDYAWASVSTDRHPLTGMDVYKDANMCAFRRGASQKPARASISVADDGVPMCPPKPVRASISVTKDIP